MKELSSTSLKQELWETLQRLKDKEVTVKEVNAVSGICREILNVVRIQVQVARLAKTQEKLSENLIFFTEGNIALPELGEER